MDYHKSEQTLKLREYGRCLQDMVAAIKAETNRDMRTRMAVEAVRCMTILNPAGKEMQDYTKKLWDHLFHIADYELDVDSPYPVPTRPEVVAKAKRPSYNKIRPRKRHYGHNIELMIQHALTLENPDERMAYVRQIASYMKLMVRVASNDPHTNDVEDYVIFQHLRELSGGQININPEETQLRVGFKPTHITNQSAPIYQRNKKKKFNKPNRPFGQGGGGGNNNPNKNQGGQNNQGGQGGQGGGGFRKKNRRGKGPYNKGPQPPR